MIFSHVSGYLRYVTCLIYKVYCRAGKQWTRTEGRAVGPYGQQRTLFSGTRICRVLRKDMPCSAMGQRHGSMWNAGVHVISWHSQKNWNWSTRNRVHVWSERLEKNAFGMKKLAEDGKMHKNMSNSHNLLHKTRWIIFEMVYRHRENSQKRIRWNLTWDINMLKFLN